MSSFEEVREMLLICLDDGLISEEEFLLLYVNSSKNPTFPHGNYSRFVLDDMDEAECLREFRVKKPEIPRLADALGLPNSFKCRQRSRAEGIEGLCVVLKRLAYPCRYSNMIHRFGRAVPELSMIANSVINWIYEHHHNRLTQWNNNLLSQDRLERYAAAVSQKGAGLANCFGFVDGTVRPICRPKENQSVVYNGHKRVHGIKFQSVTLPNGIVANMYLPVIFTCNLCNVMRLSLTLKEHERRTSILIFLSRNSHHLESGFRVRTKIRTLEF